ncbi:envelope stress response activation lipoprotein NlpE [Nissabacter sp. SGAir0207]|uniref:envelope stress response activation lipoprotein NlpE n=1 Tax=Nissabacter sp. SGAir0207 TaxID=2126321 RepID=UPI0010CD1A77|nr:envelope stress response activation lipoprotein NlpE [Nissabacter sp. SGAir0207]QCR35211.1 copper homeostasis/adhesion lipoprotein NlpE [Nissabacter sp. SGAir0207]
MKKITLALLFSLGALALIGCHHASRPQELTLQPMEQSYQGVIPCADCSGIETSLFLMEDGTYILQEHYQGRETAPRASYGQWARTADKLVLTAADGDKRYFRAHEESLEMLKRDGTPIVSTLNYTLHSVEQPLPTTPMAMHGLYHQQAGSATFQDCATGKRYPVATSGLMAQALHRLQGRPEEEPVFLTLEGHYSQPGGEQAERTLVPDSTPQAHPGQQCD